MLKLFSLKNQQKDGTAADSKGGMQKKASAAQLRVTKGEKNDHKQFRKTRIRS